MEEEKAKLDAFCEQSLKEVTDPTRTEDFQVRGKSAKIHKNLSVYPFGKCQNPSESL